MKLARIAQPICIGALLIASACSSQKVVRLTLDNEPKPTELKTLPGTSLELREIDGSSSYGHSSDQQNPDKIGVVDVKSTLRLTFHPPATDATLAADPEWKRVKAALDELGTMQTRYVELNLEAQRSSAAKVADPAPFQAKVAEFGKAQGEFVSRVFGIDPADPGRDTGSGIFKRSDLHSMIDGSTRSIYEDFNVALEARIQEIAERVKLNTDSKSEYLVTVRATLQPEAGTEQFLQVPNYYNKSADVLADDLRRSRTKEVDKLRAEYAAAQDVAAMIDELRRNGGTIVNDLKALVASARDSLEQDFTSWLGDLDAKLAAVLASKPAEPNEETQALWKDLAELAAELQSVEHLVDRLGSLDSGALPVDQLAELSSIGQELLDHFKGTSGHRSWNDLIHAIIADAPSAAGDELKALSARVKSDLRALLDRALAKLGGDLPKSLSAIGKVKQTFETGHQLIQGLDQLPTDTGSSVPHPPSDLPAAEIDLQRSATTAGDRLRIDVQVWNRAEYEADRKSGTTNARPLEAVTYTNDAIKNGWQFSGDVIFAKQTTGPSDQFASQAAVSYEWRHRYRDAGNGWEKFWNAVDPGFGFHAAALNFDPSVTTEIGVGANVSCFSGLLRAGYGYDISINDHQEYWFFGFGLISALDHIKDLGKSVFDR